MDNKLRFGAGWTNDFFFLPALEKRGRFWGAGSDDGDTNRISVSAEYLGFRLDASHQMLTHDAGKMLRTDFGEAVLRHEWSWQRGPVTLRAKALGGVALTGHLGGLELQDAFHRSEFIKARTIGNGLQDTYEGGLRVGLTLGGGAGITYAPAPWLTLAADAEAKNTFGTGLAKLSLRPSVTLRAPLKVAPFISADVGLIAQHVHDERLSLPGGYVSGAFVSPSVTAGVDFGPVQLSGTLRFNDINSGQNVGTVNLGLAL